MRLRDLACPGLPGLFLHLVHAGLRGLTARGVLRAEKQPRIGKLSRTLLKGLSKNYVN